VRIRGDFFEEPLLKRDSIAPRSGVAWNRLMAGEPPFGSNHEPPVPPD